MAIQYLRNALGATNSTTTFSITLPTTAAGDLLILEFTHRGTGDGTIGGTSVTTGGLTWNLKHSQLYASSAFSGKTYWTRATGDHSGQTVTGSGLTNSCAAILTVYSGAASTGDPLSDATVVGEQNASGDETQAQITTATDGAWVVLVVANSPDYAISSQACTSPGTLTARAERLSTGGTDTSIAHASAEKATAGATGAFTWAQTNAISGSWAYAIKPQASSTYTYTGSGGATAAGAAVTAELHVFGYVAAGGATAAGAADLAKTKSYLPQGSPTWGDGGWQPIWQAGGMASGTAVTDLVAGDGSVTYAYTGSGGATAAGAAELARGKAYEATGGATAAGSADSAKTKHFLATGGSAASGAAEYAKGKHWIGAGGGLAGGAADLAKAKNYAPTGGATASGSADTALVPAGAAVYTWTGSGGAEASGSATTARQSGQADEPVPYHATPSRPVPRRAGRTFRYVASGGARVHGSAETRFDSPARRRRRREQQLLFGFGAAQEIT